MLYLQQWWWPVFGTCYPGFCCTTELLERLTWAASKPESIPSKPALWTSYISAAALLCECWARCTAGIYLVIRFILTSCRFNAVSDLFSTQCIYEHPSISKMDSVIMCNAQADSFWSGFFHHWPLFKGLLQQKNLLKIKRRPSFFFKSPVFISLFPLWLLSNLPEILGTVKRNDDMPSLASRPEVCSGRVRADCLSYLKSLVSNSGFYKQLPVLCLSGATG